MAAVDYFLKLEGIEGESQDAKHKGEIQLDAFSWGAVNPLDPGTGQSVGKVRVHLAQFRARESKASPKLALFCVTHERIKTATLVCRRAGKEQQEFLKYTFSPAAVASYDVEGDAKSDVVPVDKFSLSFHKIEIEYRPQNPDGTLGPPVKMAYDIPAQSI
jgi:type VI secretion system secreted protein Hcp